MSDVRIFNIDADNNFVFSLTNISGTVTGPEAAAQKVAKAMFTEPGSDLFSQSTGGGLKGLLRGRNISDLRQARADVLIACRTTWETIRTTQSSDLPSDETVTGIELVDLNVIEQKWVVKIRINLEDGNSFTVGLPG
jgi:hypothetical protein